jgi:hypothetical protein
MKKLLLLVSVASLLVAALAVGCGSQSATTTTAAPETTTTAAPETTTTVAPETTTTAGPATTTTVAVSISDTYEQTAVFTGPNVPEPTDWHYDGILFDPASGRLYLADPSNAGVDVWNATSGEFIGRVAGFTGTLGIDKFEFGQVGPNGLEMDDQGHLWAGNGDGDVWIIDTQALSVIQKIPTGAKMKADVFALDSADGLMMVACGDDDPPLLVFIDANTYKVVGTLVLPSGTALGTPVWNATAGRFYVPRYNGASGEVDVINPLTRTVVRSVDLGDCVPTGMAFGPGNKAAVGAGTGSHPVIVDVATGEILLSLDPSTSERGIGDVLYDSGANRYFFADTKGIRVVDAGTLELLPTILGHDDPGGAGSRVLALDPATRRLFGGHDKEGVVVFSSTSN